LQHHSRADFGTEPKNQKTYRRFLGMIYFGEAEAAHVIAGQSLGTLEIPQNRKSAKKNGK
jgi:hypothetical protein